MKRRLILHVGPPNSGKTHAALQALCAAESGVFCAPLRLLAWEVASRVDAAGVPCSLLTGQERRVVPGGRHTACTTEMADTTEPVKVAVIDEIQMLSDPTRGWAFTRALLGVPAEEVHLCGDPAATELVRRVAQDAGETVEVHEYSRLLPLKLLSKPLEDLADVRAGDALVAFSRRAVHALRASVEELTPHRCCILYGGLPPSARAAQALAFNTPRSGYSVLASSDAIGMGLNLSIRRVIFSSLEKFDGESRRPLTPAEVRQIAGRAGRYGGRFAQGEVTTMRAEDLPMLRWALEKPTEPLQRAGLFPPTEAILAAIASRPKGGLEGALHRLADAQPPASHYAQRTPDDVIALARLVAPFKLPPASALLLALSPCDARDATTAVALVEFAATLADGDAVRIGSAMTLSALKPPRTQGELAVRARPLTACGSHSRMRHHAAGA
jgi:ATP-dependent RNA helicase SUPV3L1/SUV3